jgi:MFS superfamily sulfate permease-like transporter
MEIRGRREGMSVHWRGMIPATGWLQHYEIRWLRSDVAAGVTLAAYLLPAALGDATLAGLPPQAGLYACLCGGSVFGLFCISPRTVLIVSSAM